MHRVLHLQAVEGKAVVRLPEGLDRDDVLEEDSEAAFVVTVVGVAVVVEGPCVLKGRRAHGTEHVLPCDITLRRRGGGVRGESCYGSAGGAVDRGSNIFLDRWEAIDVDRRAVYVFHDFVSSSDEAGRALETEGVENILEDAKVSFDASKVVFFTDEDWGLVFGGNVVLETETLRNGSEAICVFPDEVVSDPKSLRIVLPFRSGVVSGHGQ